MICSSDEKERLDALAAHGPDSLLDDAELKSLVDFAGELCGAPIALVSLVEAERQRFLARRGLEATETPRSASFCQYAMVGDGIYVVNDAASHPMFADNVLVTGEPHIRFYAGAPLVSEDGFALGALCIIDSVPRPEGLSEHQRRGLSVLGRAVMRRLSDRRARLVREEAEAALADSEARFGALVDSIPQMAWSCDPDGVPDYFNARWFEYTGTTMAEMEGERWAELLHPGDGRAAKKAWEHAIATGEPYEVEYRLKRADGAFRWTLARGVPIRGEDGAITRWFGTNTDIHERREDRDRLEVVSNELSHRIKNIFSLVSGLISFEARSQPELRAITDAVRERMAALGRAHDYVRPHGVEQGATTLHGLLDELFAPYVDEGGHRVKVHGEDVAIGADATTPLALVFHELATNAVKYGALANEVGVVAVSLRREGEVLVIDWRECGGPARDGTGAASFGTNLIDMSVERQLRGTIERGWDDGFTATIRVPVSSLG